MASISKCTLLPHANTPQDAAHLARVRDNQRRSRARRKEYLQEVEGRLRECEQTGVELSAEIQAAARKVAEENKRLRMLLVRRGVSPEELAIFLNEESFAVQDNEDWAVQDLRTDDGRILEGVLKLGENGRRQCGKNRDCPPGSAIVTRQLSVSYPRPQDSNAHPLTKLGSTPELWAESPTGVHHTSQNDLLRPQTAHTPESHGGSIRQQRQLAPTSNGMPGMPTLTPQSSEESHFQPRAQVHQSVAPMPSAVSQMHHSAQILASMPNQQTQAQYQFQPQPHYPQAQSFPPQPPQQRIDTAVYPQAPGFAPIDYVGSPGQQPSYGQGIGTNSCVYATDLITSMATNAHPVDVRTDLGCSPQCATDCEVDNQIVFNVMDRYTGLQPT